MHEIRPTRLLANALAVCCWFANAPFVCGETPSFVGNRDCILCHSSDAVAVENDFVALREAKL